MLLALHFLFVMKQNQGRSHFSAFSRDTINFVKLGYCTAPPSPKPITIISPDS